MIALLLCVAAIFDARTSTVGMPARIEELVLPGSELEVATGDAASPIVLRITSASPHGDAFRYDLEFTGLDPGEYDLRAYLRRRDGSPVEADALPAIPVTVRTVLPPGQVEPHAPAAGDVDSFGGYRALTIAAAVVWTLGLLAILFVGRRRKSAPIGESRRPETLAERLEPLVERALKGELSRAERARLELGLVAYWRRKLALEDRKPDEVLALLREHGDAGPLLRSLEEWLHAPAPSGAIDLHALLAPYRHLPADALPEV